MSKVILKIGSDSERVNKEDIQEFRIEGKPVVKIKMAKDKSVLFYDRNPFYAIITDFEKYPQLIESMKLLQEERVEEAEAIINRVVTEHVAETFNTDFSTSVIYALKNSKTVALRNHK